MGSQASLDKVKELTAEQQRLEDLVSKCARRKDELDAGVVRVQSQREDAVTPLRPKREEVQSKIECIQSELEDLRCSASTCSNVERPHIILWIPEEMSCVYTMLSVCSLRQILFDVETGDRLRPKKLNSERQKLHLRLLCGKRSP